MKNRIISTAIIISSLMSFSALATATTVSNPGNCGVFVDVKADDKRCTAILYNYERKIFRGYNLDTYSSGEVYFKPDTTINRAEVLKVALATFINQDFSNQEVFGRELGFSDVMSDDTQWWFPYLKYAKENGMIQGYPDGTFKPTKDVTRTEFLKMFLYFSSHKSAIDNWVIEQEGDHWVGLWADTPPYAWYAKYVVFANNYGLFANFGNCAAGSICPEKPITRGEVATMIYNYHNYLNTEVGFPETTGAIEMKGTYYTTTTSGSAMYFMPDDLSTLEGGEYIHLLNYENLIDDKSLYAKFGFTQFDPIADCPAFHGTATILAEKYEENWDNSWSYMVFEVEENTSPICEEFREFAE
ncbi:S-layer homology domain-containing protein [Patescibacteria group bacterium]|nr:S-layer homology domain-containing protein [Patescibacteria group bacterium]